MTVREESDVAVQLYQSLDQSICSRRDLIRHFTIGAAVPKEIPPWSCRHNFSKRLTLEIAVVPFNQVRVDFRML